MSTFTTIRYDTADRLATITLARPDKRNAIDRAMFVELAKAAATAADDAGVRGVLLQGDGPSFCAGIDLGALGEVAGIGGTEFRAFVRMAQRPFVRLARMEKPVVAAVQGHALGAGFQLALACDLRVAATDVRFGMLEARYGLVPDLGGSHRLARLVGPARAKELVWSTRLVEAKEAERVGLADRVVPPEELAGAAHDLLIEVTRHSPVAVGLAKALIDRAGETSLDTELEREADAQVQCVRSEDQREAMAAFLERREPKYSGR